MGTDKESPFDPVLSRTEEIPLESAPLPSENESIEIGEAPEVTPKPETTAARGFTGIKISSGVVGVNSENLRRGTTAPETLKAVNSKALEYAVATMQGMVMMIIFNTCFITAKLVPPILGIEEFDKVIFLVFNTFFVAAALVLFYINPLMPLVTAALNIAQGLCFLFLVEIISMSIRGHAKTFYLILTALLGTTFGILNISTFAMVAFAADHQLGMFSFGSAVGGCMPYAVNVMLRYSFVPGDEKVDCYNRMLCLTGFVCVVCIVNGVLLIFFLNSPKIYTHYSITGAHGIADAKCSVSGILQGLKYTWSFYTTVAMIMLNIYLYYPGVVPGIWNIDMDGKMHWMGIFNLVVLISRTYAVFVPQRYQLRYKWSVLAMACTTIVATAYILVCILYRQIKYTTFWACLLSFFFSVVMHGYCIGYSMRNIQATLPVNLYRDVRASTILGFALVMDFSFALAYGVSSLLLHLQFGKGT